MDDSTQTKFDGQSIALFEGKFSGGFDCEFGDSSSLRVDDEVYHIVRSRVKGAAVTLTKTGDLKRTNVFAVSEAVRIDNQEGVKLSVSALVSSQINATGLNYDDPDEDI